MTGPYRSSPVTDAGGPVTDAGGTGAGVPPTAPGPSPIQRIVLEPRVRRLTVRRVEDLSRSLRRVVLAGEELHDFVALGPTDHAKVFFPAVPGGPLELPVIDGGRWTDRDDPRFLCRDYTIRTHHPDSGELVLDMAVHGHGPAGRWAAQASAGQELGLYGPKTSKIPPMDRDWYVLGADETGLPALTNWLEQLPSAPAVHAFVEVASREDEIDLPTRAGVDVTWLHRGAAEAGTTGLLADAVSRALASADGPGWVWAGAEASVIRTIRSLVAARGLDRTSFAMTGYWRRGVANFDHKSPEAQA